MINEFKTFIARGNVIDLAVGIIIGSAFGKIVTSIVDDILMPIIGIIIGGINFNTLTIKINSATIKYGAFLQSTINFLIIAICVFFIVKLVNALTKKEEEKKEVIKSEEIILLEQIRNELKKSNKKTAK